METILANLTAQSFYDIVTIIVRILLTLLIASIIGLNRERDKQAAGLRTHILVAVGACVFTLITFFVQDKFIDPVTGLATVDPSRIMANIIMGVGFLAGGTLLKKGGIQKGLTTAVSVWVTAAIGAAIGLGYYIEPFIVAIFTYLLLILKD